MINLPSALRCTSCLTTDILVALRNVNVRGLLDRYRVIIILALRWRCLAIEVVGLCFLIGGFLAVRYLVLSSLTLWPKQLAQLIEATSLIISI